MLVSFQDYQIGFGNSYGNNGLVPGFTSQVLTSATSTTGDVTITLEYFGDFNNGGTTEALTVGIEGVTFGPYTGDQYNGAFGPASPTTVNLTIDQATWATIIADGKIDVSYDLGDGFNNLSDAPNAEEFIKLSFSWNDSTVVTPGKPDPILLSGTSGNDFLPGTDGRDLINGGAGNDSIFAGNDNDIVNGGAGDDVIGGGTGADKLSGDAGNDTLFGGNGDDQIFGGEGNDVAWGGKGADVIKGDAGDDLLGGGLGRDALYGGDGADTLFGGADNDRLYGDAGTDTLYGGAGDDDLTGGKGNDFLSGGAGADTFVFGKNEGDDVVRDFNGKDGDQIDLGNQTYDVVENADGFAVLELSGGGSITLNGIAIDDVDAGWFLAA